MCYILFMKELKCGCGQSLFIDDDDYSKCCKLTWNCQKGVVRHIFNPKIGKKAYCLVISKYILGVSLLPGFLIDHIDRNTHNNQKNNLRIATYSENNSNVAITKRNSSGFKGVSYSVGARAWKACISFKRNRIFLGYFKTKEIAAKKYNEAALKYHGNFAVLNEI